MKMHENNSIIHDKNLDDHSNSNSLTEESGPTRASPVSALIKKWNNIAPDPITKWRNEVALSSCNTSTCSSKGTLQTAAVSISTGATHSLIPDSVTAAPESPSTCSGVGITSNIPSHGEKLTTVEQDGTLKKSEYDMQLKLKEEKDGNEVKQDDDDVVKNFCLANLFVEEQQRQQDEGKGTNSDAEACFPLKHACTITTVGTPTYDNDEDDDDGGIVYYYNDQDLNTSLQLTPPPVVMSDPTGMVISASANNFSKEEIEDPTLLDTSFEMEDENYDVYNANNVYTTSNINQIIRMPPPVGDRYSNRVIERTLSRTSSGTSSISFSCPSLTSASSSASSIDSCMDRSTSTSGSMSDNGHVPSPLNVYSHESASRCHSGSDSSVGIVSQSSCNKTASLSGGNTAGSINSRSMTVTQADVVDMGAGAIVILGADNLIKGPVSDVVFRDNAAGLTRHNKANSNEVDDDELMNEYLPPGLLTPPRVDRREALTDLSRAGDHENDQDDDDVQQGESAYLPSGLCFFPLEKITNPLPLPSLFKEKDEELPDENFANSKVVITQLRESERENDQDDDVEGDVESTHLPSGLSPVPGQKKTNVLTPRLTENRGDSSDDLSCTESRYEDNLPYDELLCSPTDEPPSLNPNKISFPYRARQKSRIPSTIHTSETTIDPNDSPLLSEVFSISCCDHDATSTCSSDHTHILSNCSPPRPIALDDAREACSKFMWIDCFLSILDCPGRRTRKKRERRNKSVQSCGVDSMKRKGKGIKLIKGLQLPRGGRKKASKMMQSLRQGKDVEYHNDGAGILGGHRWGESVVNDAILRMRRANRVGQAKEDNQKCILGAELKFSDGDSPKLGRRKRSENCDGNGTRSRLSSDGSSTGNLVPLERSEDSEIRRLERRALKHLKKMEFEEALSTYQMILCSYQSHINQCKLVNRTEAECEPYVGTIMHNIGIVYLLNQQYDLACKSLQEASSARASCVGKHHMDYISSITRTGLAYYAQDKFFQAREMWLNALTLLRQLPISSLSSSNTSTELSIVLNNLACAEFEVGEIKNSARAFLEALDLYRNCNVTTEAEGRQYEGCTAWKLAILRSNIGYISLRMKDADAAIIAFEAALVDQHFFPDHSILSISMLDHLFLAFLYKGKKHEALKVCSQMLKLQIETYGANHTECEKTMTKIKLLEDGIESACSKDRLHSTTEKVKDCCALVDDVGKEQHIHYQEERQLERFEKLLKVPNTWGRISLMRRSSFV